MRSSYIGAHHSPMLYAADLNCRDHVEGMAQYRGAAPVYPSFPDPNFRSVPAIIGPEENVVVSKEGSGAVRPRDSWRW